MRTMRPGIRKAGGAVDAARAGGRCADGLRLEWRRRPRRRPPARLAARPPTTSPSSATGSPSDLDAGDTCNAAHAADDLKAAVEDSDLPANLRPGVDAVAGDLVDQVNCPPPPPPPPSPRRSRRSRRSRRTEATTAERRARTRPRARQRPGRRHAGALRSTAATSRPARRSSRGRPDEPQPRRRALRARGPAGPRRHGHGLPRP